MKTAEAENIVPDTDSAEYSQGFQAFEQGQHWDKCPYPISCDGRVEWMSGWIQARTNKELASFIKRFGPI